MKQFASAQCVISISKVSPIVVTPLGNSQYPLKVSKSQIGICLKCLQISHKTKQNYFQPTENRFIGFLGELRHQNSLLRFTDL